MLEDVQKALPERRDRVLDGVKLGCRKKDYLCKPKIKGGQPSQEGCELIQEGVNLDSINPLKTVNQIQEKSRQ